MSQPIKYRDNRLGFPIDPKNTNLVEGVEIFRPVNIRCIPFSGFRGEVKNISAIQRPGRPSCVSDQPENINLVEDLEILLRVKLVMKPLCYVIVNEVFFNN